jgi:hypothetical protein
MGQTEISGHCYVKNGELDVVDFACAKSRCVGILYNLSDMRRKPSACVGKLRPALFYALVSCLSRITVQMLLQSILLH